METICVLVGQYKSCMNRIVEDLPGADCELIMNHFTMLLGIAQTIYTEAILSRNTSCITFAGNMLRNTTIIIINMGELMTCKQFDMTKVETEVLPVLSNLKTSRFYN